MKSKITDVSTGLIFILCIPVLLLTASIGYAANSLPVYEYGFREYDVGSTTGLTEPELEKAARGLISYFNSGEEFISLTVEKDSRPFVIFNQQEIIHLKDVKGLIRLDYFVLLGTLVYVLGYVIVCLLWKKGRYRRRLSRVVIWGSGVTLALMLALWLGVLLEFDRLFTQFHLISFANDFWLLDPAEDYLIMLFPSGFWYDVTLFCALGTAAAAIILAGISGGYLFLGKRLLHLRQ